MIAVRREPTMGWARLVTTGLLVGAASTLIVAMSVDPTHEVAESNETNNTGWITVNLTGYSAPPGIAETPVPCS